MTQRMVDEEDEAIPLTQFASERETLLVSQNYQETVQPNEVHLAKPTNYFKKSLLNAYLSVCSHRGKPNDSNHSDACSACGYSTKARRRRVLFLSFALTPLILLGILQGLTLVSIVLSKLYPDNFRPVLLDWSQIGKDGHDLKPWPHDFTRDVRPVPCHSHNDYFRDLPLYSALSAGCISVEADVWLIDGNLYVGHGQQRLSKNRTLQSLYIDPLLEILERQNSVSDPVFKTGNTINGVFGGKPEQGIVLLIDFKNEPNDTWIAVRDALEPLRSRSYLSHWNGTDLEAGVITVVGTGATPFDHVNSQTHNPNYDVFFDAPLDQMANPDVADIFTTKNSYYASVSFGDTIGRLWSFSMTDAQTQLLREQIKGAHDHGLLVRYWDLPEWPISLRNQVWEVLVREGVDILNVDDLKAATALDWRKTGGAFR